MTTTAALAAGAVQRPRARAATAVFKFSMEAGMASTVPLPRESRIAGRDGRRRAAVTRQ